MMTLEDFKKSNMCWNGNGYYTTDKEWNSNYQIAKNVEKEFLPTTITPLCNRRKET